MPPLQEWFSVRFDNDTIHLQVRPPNGASWEAWIPWERILRVCFKASDLFESDEIYLFTDERPESYLIPTEADGGQALWAKILERKLFDAEMAIEAATATNELFCSPPRSKKTVGEEFPLYSPRQLPELEGEKLLLTWNQIDADTLISQGDALVWRERTGWEVYDRFEEIAVILKHRYGSRLIDLVPTPGSHYALYGDSTAASFHVAAARESLARDIPVETFHWHQLEAAVREGDAATIKRYLAQNGDPNIRSVVTASTDTLLHVAGWRRRPHIARMLIAAGADVNAMSTLEQPPLVAALDTIRMPAARPPARRFRIAPEALQLASTTEMVKLLVHAGANLSGLSRPFHEVSGPNRQMYRSPLTLAAQYGYLDALRFLLEHGADIEAEDHFGDTPLIQAYRHGQAEAAQILLDAGANVNREPYSPNGSADTQLQMVIQSQRFDDPGHKIELILRMIEAGADVNKANTVGDSPLLTAVRYGTDHRYSLIGSTDAAGNVAWEVTKWPVWEQKMPQAQIAAILRLLRAAGADVNARDRDGMTARELASEAGLTELLELL